MNVCVNSAHTWSPIKYLSRKNKNSSKFKNDRSFDWNKSIKPINNSFWSQMYDWRINEKAKIKLPKKNDDLKNNKNKYKVMNKQREIAYKLPSMKIQIDLNTLNKGSWTNTHRSKESIKWCLKLMKHTSTTEESIWSNRIKLKDNLLKHTRLHHSFKENSILYCKYSTQKDITNKFKSRNKMINSKQGRNHNMDLTNPLSKIILNKHWSVDASNNLIDLESPLFGNNKRSKLDVQTEISDFTCASVNLTNSFCENEGSSSTSIPQIKRNVENSK